MSGPESHSRFRRAVRGLVVAEAAFESYRPKEAGWEEIRESWMRLQRNGKPTPWSGLFGKASMRSGAHSELGQPGCGGRRKHPTASVRAVGTGRVQVDADHYYYALGPGTVTPMLVTDGALTWRYAGQVIFSSAPLSGKGAQGRWRSPPSVAPKETQVSDYFAIGESFRTDHLGRLWLLESVDEGELAAARDRYNKKVDVQFGRAESSGLQPPRHRLRQQETIDDTSEFVYPLWSWSTWTYCGGDDTIETFERSDDPMAFETPLNERGKKVVFIYDGTGGWCSGTMVDGSRHILTAAHCVYLDSGHIRNSDYMYACTYGNSQDAVPSGEKGSCFAIEWLHPLPKYDESSYGSLDEHDAAIVTLYEPLPSEYQVGWMALSNRTDFYDDEVQAIRGYPGGIGDCVSAAADSPIVSMITDRVPSDDPGADGPLYVDYARMQATAHGSVVGGDGLYLKNATSSAHGMSGGPHYYCPTGDCDDTYLLTSVAAYMSPGTFVTGSETTLDGKSWGSYWGWGGWTGGPRSSSLRDWVAGYTS